MKYILQQNLKTKTKDIESFPSMGVALMSAKNQYGLRLDHISYFGTFPVFYNEKGRPFLITLQHESGLMCSPSKEDREIIDNFAKACGISVSVK